VREILHKHSRFFLFSGLAGLALRLLFLYRFPAITADSFIYGDIARNWLQHGIYGLTELDQIVPTYIRLPGYPAFLALVFRIFGMDHYRAALLIQIFVDFGTCFIIADIARRAISERAARVAFLLSALCPFFANYSAAALTETLEIFFTALALDLAFAGVATLQAPPAGSSAPIIKLRYDHWLACGSAIAACLLLRPDGGLLLAAILIYLFWILGRRLRHAQPLIPVLKAGLILTLVALAPLAPWTLRNLHTLHTFQPLAPRYANEEDSLVPMGFNRWTKTWMADYVSNEEVYWMVPGSPIDSDKLPSRAFDSADQQDQTEQLLADYNQQLRMTPGLDARFAALAQQRIRAAPLRYYVSLPLLRIADMWLRPRTELLPSDSRWWEFDDTTRWSILAVVIGAINLLYIGAACLGLIRGHFAPYLGLLLTFAVLRSLFLGTMENPEPRYTLECYPVVIVLASALFQNSRRSRGEGILRKV
jgi:4-amino-4-deoxy-L-arabinose transferase-like glycosyltransferase